MPRHVVVVIMLLAMHLASLEVAVLHAVARVRWVVVALCEFAGRLVQLARRVQDPLHADIKQFAQCPPE
eukprot:10654386-Lingulodinium_polyedra.AAC.1